MLSKDLNDCGPMPKIFTPRTCIVLGSSLGDDAKMEEFVKHLYLSS
jgi:hypothetical protein